MFSSSLLVPSPVHSSPAMSSLVTVSLSSCSLGSPPDTVQQRRLSASVRTLATAATSSVPSRPRLEKLRADGLAIDDFLSGNSEILEERTQQDRVVMGKSKT